MTGWVNDVTARKRLGGRSLILNRRETRENILDARNTNHLDPFHRREAFCSRRKNDPCESQFGSFCDPSIRACHRTHFAGKSHFTTQGGIHRDSDIHVAAEYGTHHRKVHSWFLHTKATSEIEEDILLAQPEAASLFEDG